ncbi:hypothetical protein HAX54_011049 [Datura stramonium]|uniref:Uncharacterized protein n=1 Tax=Datura stramonium TaxID=4076 RepID=A0ABS8TIS9_DATST|nr:hypothetical protein [Datura stramonium]
MTQLSWLSTLKLNSLSNPPVTSRWHKFFKMWKISLSKLLFSTFSCAKDIDKEKKKCLWKQQRNSITKFEELHPIRLLKNATNNFSWHYSPVSNRMKFFLDDLNGWRHVATLLPHASVLPS